MRIPGEIAARCGLRDGERIEIETRDGDLILRRAPPRFTLAELFGGKTAEEWRALYHGAFDWRPDRGREAIEE